MINESKYWKVLLLKIVSKFERWEKTEKLTQQEHAEIGREIMIGFYSIRKLYEAHKLSVKILEVNLKVRIFPNIKKITFLNNHRPN